MWSGPGDAARYVPSCCASGWKQDQGPVCGVGPRLLKEALYPVLPCLHTFRGQGLSRCPRSVHGRGACPRCIIDNTSVLVAHGSGPEAEIAPEMERFGQVFGIKFIPHAIGDADRKAKMERNFSYVEHNFLAGRPFADWHDLNEQAKRWCQEVANQKVKRSLGMSPEAAYLMEKPHLTLLPPYIPPVYQTFYRTVDVAGYVQIDTNRYSPQK